LRRFQPDSCHDAAAAQFAIRLASRRVLPSLTRGGTPAGFSIHDALIWDDHSGFDPVPDYDLEHLEDWRQAGVNYLSIDVAYDVIEWERAIKTLGAYITWLEKRPDRFMLGGVIGVTGLGYFLPDRPSPAIALADCVTYVRDLVGVDHVGLGLDYTPPDPKGSGDTDLAAHPDFWPPAEYTAPCNADRSEAVRKADQCCTNSPAAL
jgi:hypothetical protein